MGRAYGKFILVKSIYPIAVTDPPNTTNTFIFNEIVSRSVGWNPVAPMVKTRVSILGFAHFVDLEDVRCLWC